MIALTYELHAEQPLLLTRLEGDPNSSVSYRYVPGSAVRGALVARYLARAEQPPHDLAHPEKGERALFFDGSVRYLNAYPLDRLGGRCLPTPRSWFRPKREEIKDKATIYDLAVEDAQIEEPKLVDKPFCRLVVPQPTDDDYEPEIATVEFVSPGWQINVHTTRERVKGRATGDEGAVFRYQAIAAGESFGGVILVDDAEDADAIEKLLESGDVWLGRAQSAGYGRVQVTNVEVHKEWSEVARHDGSLAPGDRLIVTLLSDAILRNRDGSLADALVLEMLSPYLGNTIQASGEVYKRVVPVGGFNRKWGLPLNQVQAIEAGSVFVFEVTAPIPATALEGLEAAGIGERRIDGFGRVAANWHPAGAEIEVRELKVRPKPGDLDPEPMSAVSQALAQGMVDRLWRQDLARRLAHYVQELDLGDDPSLWPSNAQLSRLRSIALNALPKHDIDRMRNFFDSLRPRGREQYERARVDGRRLLAWLQERIKDPKQIWDTLKLGECDLPRPSIGAVQAGESEEMAIEYTLRLVEGVLHRMARERRESERRAKELSHE